MKKSVLERKMFVGSSSNRESNGILSGFDEEIEADYEERTPDNLEIIANNLRGDMRSMDERYMELAQMVGESAFDTPEEVVALMQAQFAQQAAPQGIAGVGAPQVPPATGGIMAGMAPQQPPMQMAHGGLVHRQTGSPPGGEVSRRQLGFMRYLPPGTIPAASEVPPRSVPIPRVDLSGTPAVGGRMPILSAEAANLMRSGALAGGPSTLPQQIPMTLRASTAAAEGARNIIPFTREATRALMSTPQGRGAAMIGTALGATPFLLSGEAPPEGGPEFSEVPGVDAQGRYRPVLRSLENMPGTPEQKAAIRRTGFTDIEGIGMGTLGKGPTPEQVMGTIPRPATAEEKPTERKAVEAPATTVTPPPVDRAQEFRDRVKEKMDIYKEFLGDDPEFRKAQALFLLAESALNVAGAKGYSTGERLAKGLKGLPAGMAAIGAEAEKSRRGIAAAAVSAVEQEFADARRLATTLAREQIRKGPGISSKVQSLFSSIKSRMPGMDDDVALQLAVDWDNGTVYQDKNTKELYDAIGDKPLRWSPYKPLSPTSVGFIDPNNPYAKVSDQQLEQILGPKERQDLLKEREKLQKNLPLYDRFLADVYGDTVGILPTIRSGVSQVTLALFGDVGFKVTNVEQNAIRQRAGIANEYVTRGLFRNNNRTSNLDMTRAESLAKDPNKLVQSAEQVVTTIQNFAQQDMNRLAEIDSQLFGVPTKVIGRIPSGSKTDMIDITANIYPILNEAFTKRPNLAVWVRYPDGQTERITAQRFFEQQKGQAQ